MLYVLTSPADIRSGPLALLGSTDDKDDTLHSPYTKGLLNSVIEYYAEEVDDYYNS